MNSLFRLAIISSDLGLVKHFVAKGEDVNCIDKQGNSALMLAIKYCSVDIFKYLLEQNADINYVSPKGESVLELAENSNNPSMIDFIRLFLHHEESEIDKSDHCDSNFTQDTVQESSLLEESFFDSFTLDTDEISTDIPENNSEVLDAFSKLDSKFENTDLSDTNYELSFLFSEETNIDENDENYSIDNCNELPTVLEKLIKNVIKIGYTSEEEIKRCLLDDINLFEKLYKLTKKKK